FEAAGYIPTDPAMTRPDVQICFVPLMANTDGSSVIHGHGYTATVLILRPKSRGALTLRSADPRQHPLIRVNYLQDSDDLRPLREGLRRARHILSQKAFDSLRGEELAPGNDVQSDAEIDAFSRATGKSSHHLCGTCRMGEDDQAVVDSKGRVRGLEGLRVVDASIIPSIPSANINAPVIMMAEKLSDAILGKPPLPPESEPALRAN
ncbi:MAG: GMC oxidoreductase, partial [Pseudorhodoplanes sp.]